MSENTITVVATRSEVERMVATIPSLARTRGPLSDVMMSDCGDAILGRIHTAFVTKSLGGTDEAGDKWRDLSPTTIAYRRMRGSRTRTEKRRSSRPSQGLNAKQQARWWEVYRKQLAVYKGDKGHAAAAAWTVLKKEGARTLVDKYGNARVDILQETRALVKSLMPNARSEYSVFRIGNGEIIVGTNRPWAWTHHRGTKRTPQRRLWPEPEKWPESWWNDIQEPALQGLLKIALALFQGM